MSAALRVELHCHTNRSDGSDSPERLMSRARGRGLAVFAITDHDTCTPAQLDGVRCLRGAEITCDDRGRTLHVLAYDRGGDWALLENEFAAVRRRRRDRLAAMAERLGKLGVAVDIAPLLADADRRAVGRPDLARIVVAAGRASTMKEAFSKYLYDGGPVDIAHEPWPVADVLARGRDAGAAMSLAHPHHYDSDAADIMRTYKDAGLTGLEAFYGSYDAARRRRWVELADGLGATCTGGSDWHGDERPDLATQLGVELPQKRADALLQWLG
nr:PHP domain-containing protein [Kofleriaceae bacterium]